MTTARMRGPSTDSLVDAYLDRYRVGSVDQIAAGIGRARAAARRAIESQCETMVARGELHRVQRLVGVVYVRDAAVADRMRAEAHATAQRIRTLVAEGLGETRPEREVA